MSIANILVYLNADRVSEPLINVAAGLVDKFSARLIGLSALSPIPAFAAERAVIVDTASQIDAKKLKISLDRVEHKFRGIAGTLRRVEWRSSLDAPLQALTTEARSADLIVLGQTKGPVDAYRTLDNGAAVIGAGRPTLIVPETVNSLLAQNIIVGWKDTREARRAVQDSLPFLKKAKHISIVEICEAREKYAAQKNVEDVARYLKQHGIEAEARAEASHDQPDSDKFLDLAGREGADLLVLGAYGHSRFNEWVFGGMTRELMTTSPICCLFSH